MTKLKKAVKPIFWISGNQRDCQQSWESIVAKIENQHQQSPNIITMFCGFNPVKVPLSRKWATTNDVIQLLRTPDMFDSRPRIIKLIGLPEEYSSLSQWVHLINDKNVLVMWGPFGYIKPGTKQWITAKTNKLYKIIKSEGILLDHPVEASSLSDGIKWVNTVAEKLGKTFDDDTARILIKSEGNNLDTLTNYTQKLATYVSTKKITLDDVTNCCSANVTDNIWSYLENLDRHNIDLSLKFLCDFYNEDDGAVGESFYGRIQRFFGAVFQHFLFLMLVKDACPSGIEMCKIEKSAQEFKKTTPTKIKELMAGKITKDELVPRFSSGYISQNLKTNNFTRKSLIYTQLNEVYRTMYQCRLRSSSKAYLRLCLDVMTLTICGKLTPSQACQIRGDNQTIRV